MWKQLARSARLAGEEDRLERHHRPGHLETGWAAHGHPEYGQFKLGHTNPGYLDLRAFRGRIRLLRRHRQAVRAEPRRRPACGRPRRRPEDRELDRALRGDGRQADRKDGPLRQGLRPCGVRPGDEPAQAREQTAAGDAAGPDRAGRRHLCRRLSADRPPTLRGSVPNARAAATEFRRWLVPKITAKHVPPRAAFASGARPVSPSSSHRSVRCSLRCATHGMRTARPPTSFSSSTRRRRWMRPGRLDAAQQGLALVPGRALAEGPD